MLWLLWAILPFYFNEVLFLLVKREFLPFLTIDYGSRIVALWICAEAYRRGHLTKDSLGFRWFSWGKFLVVSIAMSLIGVGIVKVLRVVLPLLFTDWQPVEFPDYPSALARWIDLTFGMLLVAVSEEIIFRGWLMNFLREKFSALAVCLISLLVFAGAHWGSGLHSVIIAFFWGILPTIYFWRKRSIYPLLVAHFTLDFLVYFQIGQAHP